MGGTTSLSIWLALVAGGLITYATRLSFIYIIGSRDIPGWLRRTLRFVPPAVLSAILLPELLIHSGRLDISLGNHRLLAGVLAALVAWRTGSALLTIGAGMLALLALAWLV